MGDGRFIKPDSVMVRVADDLLGRHRGSEPGAECAGCGLPSPCPAARNAAEIRRAAGLPVAVRLTLSR